MVVYVTFKFVCFDRIEGKKLADEVARKKGERKKKIKKERGRKRALCGMFWSVEEVVGKKKEERRKKKKEKKVRVHVWRRKKEGKKRKEIQMKRKKKEKGKIK